MRTFERQVYMFSPTYAYKFHQCHRFKLGFDFHGILCWWPVKVITPKHEIVHQSTVYPIETYAWHQLKGITFGGLLVMFWHSWPFYCCRYGYLGSLITVRNGRWLDGWCAQVHSDGTTTTRKNDICGKKKLSTYVCTYSYGSVYVCDTCNMGRICGDVISNEPHEGDLLIDVPETDG